jgi:hypothetical protein
MIKKTSHAQRDSWKAFFRRHNRLFSFVGALIVFTTFVVKEGVREQLKDVSDSLSEAQNQFVLRNDGNVSARIVESLQSQLTLFQMSTPKLRQRGATEEVLKLMDFETQGQTALTASAWSSKRSIDNLAKLVEELPSRQSYETRIKDLNIEIKGYVTANTIGAAGEMLESAMDFFMGTDEAHMKLKRKALVEKIAVRQKELNDGNWRIFNESQAVATDVLHDADELRHKRKRCYTIWTWASYFLYSLGWSLGLVAKWYGKEDLSSEE